MVVDLHDNYNLVLYVHIATRACIANIVQLLTHTCTPHKHTQT